MTIPFWITVFHGIFTLITIVIGLFVANELLWTTPDERWARRLKRVAVLSSIFAFLVIFTGTYSYMIYRLPIPTSPRSVILQTKPWVHEVSFEVMEYGGLFGPLLAILVTALIFSSREELMKLKDLRTGIGNLILVGILIALVMSSLGFIPTLIKVVM